MIVLRIRIVSHFGFNNTIIHHRSNTYIYIIIRIYSVTRNTEKHPMFENRCHNRVCNTRESSKPRADPSQPRRAGANLHSTTTGACALLCCRLGSCYDKPKTATLRTQPKNLCILRTLYTEPRNISRLLCALHLCVCVCVDW